MIRPETFPPHVFMFVDVRTTCPSCGHESDDQVERVLVSGSIQSWTLQANGIRYAEVIFGDYDRRHLTPDQMWPSQEEAEAAPGLCVALYPGLRVDAVALLLGACDTCCGIPRLNLADRCWEGSGWGVASYSPMICTASIDDCLTEPETP